MLFLVTGFMLAANFVTINSVVYICNAWCKLKPEN